MVKSLDKKVPSIFQVLAMHNDLSTYVYDKTSTSELLSFTQLYENINSFYDSQNFASILNNINSKYYITLN